MLWYIKPEECELLACEARLNIRSLVLFWVSADTVDMGV